MPPNSAHGKLDSEETNAAAWQATRGAVTGAARMSGMIFGSVIEADERLRIYGERSRRQKVMARDAAVWRKYEEEFESLGISGIASEARAKKGSSEEQEQEK
ncbi:hypothetical protein D6D21_01758 [Aureobasidium pullulans]|uniref:Uncharacterized protein n=1 Tax=Aureobasidium pullulans TaxID=5580 RepID=A0AB74J7A1_AURPU|nr:hypothetical protein D6D21_01758 [Aureobasidium pullulans]